MSFNRSVSLRSKKLLSTRILFNRPPVGPGRPHLLSIERVNRFSLLLVVVPLVIVVIPIMVMVGANEVAKVGRRHLVRMQHP